MPSRNIVRHHGKRGAHGPDGGQLYAAIPMELARDSKLSVYARAVVVYVWSHDEKWQQSASSVADALGMDRGTVSKALTELQERGWLVREIHQSVGPSGKARTAWECWHLQMTNRRFTSEEILVLSTPSDVLLPPAPHHQTCGPHPHGGAAPTRTGGAGPTRTIEVECRNAPEVHSRNANTGEDETGLESRSLADAGRGTVATASGSSHDDPWADAGEWLAGAEAREAREARAQAAERERHLALAAANDPWGSSDN